MELFKIKLIPKVKDRDWEVRHIRNNRKEKKCEICNNIMPVGASSTTFTKRTTTGAKTAYETHHTCAPTHGFKCINTMSEKLGIKNEAKSWVN